MFCNLDVHLKTHYIAFFFLTDNIFVHVTTILRDSGSIFIQPNAECVHQYLIYQ